MNPSFNTIGNICEFIKIELRGQYPEREINNLIEIIISHLLDIPKHEIHIEKNKPVDDAHNLRIIEIVKELKTGKPVQYILGYTEFYGLTLNVAPVVLIPRPETEELVKWIIDDHARESDVILDIGTGSGCIAVALKKNMPLAEIYACDISSSALKIAKENARSNNADIVFFCLDILSPDTPEYSMKPEDFPAGAKMIPQIHPFYDLIVSNPPYIPIKEKPLININVSGFEPGNALFVPDEDPLMFYRHIANFGSDHLKKNGQIYFEIHEKSGLAIKNLLEKSGYKNVIIRRDINGKDRMIKCFK